MEWLIDWGYLGLFIGTFLAGTALPMSSDVLLIGMLAMGASPWLCLIAASLGNWLGAMVSYVLGWFTKWRWLEKWFKVKRETLERQKPKIDKYGVWLAFFSWAPFIGTASMIALGVYKVKPKTTTILTLTGCFVRFLFWITLNHIYNFNNHMPF